MWQGHISGLETGPDCRENYRVCPALFICIKCNEPPSPPPPLHTAHFSAQVSYSLAVERNRCGPSSGSGLTIFSSAYKVSSSYAIYTVTKSLDYQSNISYSEYLRFRGPFIIIIIINVAVRPGSVYSALIYNLPGL